MDLDGLDAELQVAGHLAVGVPGGDELRDRDLLRRERARVVALEAAEAGGAELAVAARDGGRGLELLERGAGGEDEVGGAAAAALAAQELAEREPRLRELVRAVERFRELDRGGERALGGVALAVRGLQPAADDREPGLRGRVVAGGGELLVAGEEAVGVLALAERDQRVGVAGAARARTRARRSRRWA